MDKRKETIWNIMSDILKKTESLKSLIATDWNLDRGICPNCKKLAINDVYMSLEGYCKDCVTLKDEDRPANRPN